MSPTGTLAVDPIRRLMLELARLPGVGERSAARLAYSIIRRSCPARAAASNQALELAAALQEVVHKVASCEACGALSAQQPCEICADPRRGPQLVCVVEGMAQLRAIEQGRHHRGVYHVLHGRLAPLDGIGPDDLNIASLLGRLRQGQTQEVLLATGTDVEGDTTALYLAQLLRPLATKITRLASGVPMGGELEYLDTQTLGRAIAQRQPV